MNNRKAFNSGTTAGPAYNHDRDAAFYAYREACEFDGVNPSVSASVCFVAGYLGKPYPSQDERVTS